MVEYFRGTAHVCRLLSIGALALFSVITSQSSFAQNGASRNNGNTAVLHIRVNIVPVVMSVPPSPEPNLPPVTAVTYNVSITKPNVDVLEETRPFHAPVSSGAGTQDAVLRTVTIVMR